MLLFAFFCYTGPYLGNMAKPTLIVFRSTEDKAWYKNGKLHRDNGLPALEQANGAKAWCINGVLYRFDDWIDSL